VAEVGHLGLRRWLRGRRGRSRAAPGPDRSRHVWWSRTTLGKREGSSTGSGGAGAGGWGSLRRLGQIHTNQWPSIPGDSSPPPRKAAGGGEARAGGGRAEECAPGNVASSRGRRAGK
jgi:hypothetical protein